MDLLKSKKRKSKISDLVYTGLNLGLAIAILISINVTGSPWLAFAIVLLSKWRVLAVRPRFWSANILANLVDFFVSLSIVTFIYVAIDNLALQVVLTAFYAIWLLFIKPQSSRRYILIQAAIGLFLAVSALVTISYEWDVFFQVIIMWLIGYSVTRHVLTHFDEQLHGIYSGIFGLLMAELGWISHHWSFAYSVPGLSPLLLSQTAIIALLFFIISYHLYAHKHDSQEKKRSDWLIPIIFSVLTIIILILFFNTPQGGQGGI